MSMHVAIVGGGVAGIASAVRLADAGVRVTLIETRKRLGGRATSFVDPQTGEVLDNCQHVLMRCCTHLLDLYGRLGVVDLIDWHARFHFIDVKQAVRDGKPHVDTLEGDDLPAPLHLAWALLGLRYLSLVDKLAIGRAMFAMIRLGREGRRAVHGQCFEQWLRDHGQTQAAIDRFWSTIIVSACNARPSDCAADYAIQVFQEGFMANADAYVMGLSRVPLLKLYDAAEAVIRKGGGHVMLGTSVAGLSFDGTRVTALQFTGGESLEADSFLSTVPFDRLAKLCDEAMSTRDDRLQATQRHDVSPIIGVHLWYDRPITDQPHVAFVNSPLHWIFRRHEGTVTRPPEGAHYHAVISAADELVDAAADTVAALCDAELRKALPVARFAALLRSRVIKEKRATFLPSPGIDAARPGPRGDIANLYLAGDWTDTGWPATMEGAARSGYFAANALLEDAGHLAPSLPSELPASALYAALSPSAAKQVR